MERLLIAEGDVGFDILFTITDSDGAAYLLTGYTIKFKVWVPGTTGTLIVDGTCDIVVAASGTCKYTLAANDFDDPAAYYAELQLTKTGVQESTEVFEVVVMESP